MGDWLQDRCNEIQKAQQEHIQKSFGSEDIEKARSGIYKPTKQNLKEGKVGRKYGEDKKEDRNYTDSHLEKLVQKEKVNEKYFEDMYDKELKYLYDYANANLFNVGLNPSTKERVKEWWKASLNEISRRNKSKK